MSLGKGKEASEAEPSAESRSASPDASALPPCRRLVSLSNTSGRVALLVPLSHSSADHSADRSCPSSGRPAAEATVVRWEERKSSPWIAWTDWRRLESLRVVGRTQTLCEVIRDHSGVTQPSYYRLIIILSVVASLPKRLGSLRSIKSASGRSYLKL